VAGEPSPGGARRQRVSCLIDRWLRRDIIDRATRAGTERASLPPRASSSGRRDRARPNSGRCSGREHSSPFATA